MLGIISFWSPGALFWVNPSDATVVTDLRGGFWAWFGIFLYFWVLKRSGLLGLPSGNNFLGRSSLSCSCFWVQLTWGTLQLRILSPITAGGRQVFRDYEKNPTRLLLHLTNPGCKWLSQFMTGSPLAQQSCHGYSNSRTLKAIICYIYEISNAFQSALSTTANLHQSRWCRAAGITSLPPQAWRGLCCSKSSNSANKVITWAPLG